MQLEVSKKRFTVDEYHQMGEAGIFGPEERVELIDGEIIEMTPIGDRHAVCVLYTNNVLARILDGKALVNVQNPLRLNSYNEPQPDIAVLKSDWDYRRKKIGAEDALLVIEVSETSLRYDRNVKIPHYAAAGVPEVWLINLQADEIIVYREPTDAKYLVQFTLRRGDSLSLVAFPGISVPVDEIL